MKVRLLVVLLAAALMAAPAGARPLAVSHQRGTSWVRAWQGFLGFFHGFHLFEASSASEHGLPPPSYTIAPSIW